MIDEMTTGNASKTKIVDVSIHPLSVHPFKSLLLDTTPYPNEEPPLTHPFIHLILSIHPLVIVEVCLHLLLVIEVCFCCL